MKLSTKTTLIFLIMIVISSIAYFLTGAYLSDYLYDGETTRITGITSGVMSRIDGEIGKLTGKSKDYVSLISAAEKLEGKFGLDGYKELGIDKKFERDGVDYKLTLDNQLEIDQVYGLNKEQVQEEVGLVIEAIRPLVDDNPKQFQNGIVSTEKGPYFVGLEPIVERPSGQLKGYFLLVDGFGEKKIAQLSRQMEKNLTLVEDYDKENETRHRIKGEGDAGVVATADTVCSYYELPLMAGEKPYYVQLTEPLVIRNESSRNINAVSGLMVVCSGIIFVILWLLIDRLVVKRLHAMSEGVKAIKENASTTGKLEIDHAKDEITQLAIDVNEMVEALESSHETIVQNEQKYSYLLRTMSNGFARYKMVESEDENEINAVCEEVNKTFLELYGYKESEIIGKTIKELSHQHILAHGKKLKPIISAIEQTGEHFNCGEVEIKPGIWCEITIYMIEENSFAIIWTDITSLKRYSEQMKNMAQYDGLTGLYNRYSLTKMIEETKDPYTIYFMDIDNFKDINDAMGHHIGDEVLCEVAQQLKGFENSMITAARIGGDEFVIIQKGECDDTAREQFASHILETINRTYIFGNYAFELSGSIGVSCYPEHADNQKNLLRYADIAMYKSKHQGGKNFTIFSESMLEEIELEAELRDGIAKDEFEAFYQPIYDVNRNKTIGAEALVRWMRNGEVIAPFKFIPLAKKTGDIAAIDQIILEKACLFCKEQRDKGYENFEVSVNASYRWLMQPDVLDYIDKALDAAKLSADGLKLEITEDEVMDNPPQVIKLLQQIKKKGIRISLDDFGVGYSSFNYIKMLPIDVLKIDRSLLLELDKDYKTKSIIETMIKLSHTLGLEVVCEGVETQDQMDLLKTVDCDKIQGYLISKPIPKIEFDTLMNAQAQK